MPRKETKTRVRKAKKSSEEEKKQEIDNKIDALELEVKAHVQHEADPNLIDLELCHQLDGVQTSIADDHNNVKYLSDMDDPNIITIGESTLSLDAEVAKAKKRVKLNKLEAFDEFIKAGVYSNTGGQYELLDKMHKFLKRNPKAKQNVLEVLYHNGRIPEHSIIADYDYEPHTITKTSCPSSILMVC